MAYEIIRPATPTRHKFMWELQNLLRSSSFSNWTYVDGYLGGSVATSGDWDAITNPDAEVVDGDYVVLHIPSVTSSLNGVVAIVFNDNTGVEENIEMRAFPAGWDGTAHTPNEPSQTLGDSTCIICGVGGASDVEEMRVIANSNRAIIWGMGSSLSPYYFGYLGFIQSFYGALEGDDDPNPLLVTGGQNHPGQASAPLFMLRIDEVPDTYFANAKVNGLVATDGSDMLDFQWNRREDPPVPTRVLIPCIVGCQVVGNTELRGELEGVFFYGPAGTIAEDTPLTRSDGQYIVIGDIVTGPVAPVV